MGAALGLLGGLAGGAGTGMQLLQVGLGLVSDMASAAGQQQAAQAQADYQRRLSEQQRDENYEKQVVQRQEEAMEKEKVSREQRKAQLERRASVATAVTSAAEAGATGLSVDALIQDYNIQSSMQIEALERQKQFSEIATQTNVENIAKDQYIPGPVEMPGMGGALINGVSGIIGVLGGK